jgi:hypothetical protein
MIRKFISFFTEIPKDSWRDVVLSSLLIPLVFYLFTKMRLWLVSIKPLNMLLTGYKKPEGSILIFLSQLSGANDQGNVNLSQRYLAFFPKPLPNNQNHREARQYQNVDPVWSQSDGLCTSEVFNLLGHLNGQQRIKIADTLKDWNDRSSPVFTVGFNPKTLDLMSSCTPINFRANSQWTCLSIDGNEFALNANYPNDAGVVQKTFYKNSNIPVFILAGLGTTGTEVSGKVLNQNRIALGKLYGSAPFCVLFKTDIQRGNNYYEITGLFPKPKSYRAIWYPITFFRLHRKNVFVKS